MEEEKKIEELEVEDVKTELNEEEAKELFGDIVDDVPLSPQTHGEEENYEVGDTNI